MVDRSEGLNCWTIHGLGTRHQVYPAGTTNVVSFCGPISDIPGSSNSRTRTHAAGNSRHVVHRAQTRSPASRDICGQRFARSQPCSPGRDGVILGLGVTERSGEGTIRSESGEATAYLGPSCRCNLVLSNAMTPAPRCQHECVGNQCIFLLLILPRKRKKPKTQQLQALSSQHSSQVSGGRTTPLPCPVLATRVSQPPTHFSILP